MDEKVMITCPYHQQKKFFRCKECKDIEVECEYCKCKWLVTIWADANGFKADYKKNIGTVYFGNHVPCTPNFL